MTHIVFTEIVIPNFTEVLLRYWRQLVLLAPKLVFAVLIISATIFFATQLSKLLIQKLRIHAADPLLISFIAQIGKWLLILAGFILALSVLGLDNVVGGLIAGAGVSALVFGFAFKDIGENFLSGIILAFNRPFHVNDTIGIDSFTGKVLAMGLRSTRIKTFDGQDVYIPNSTLMKSNLINFTADGLVRLDFKLQFDFTSDLDAATQLICETLLNVKGVLQEEGPFCAIEEITTQGALVRAYFWTNTLNYSTHTLDLKTKAIKQTIEALQQAGYKLVGMPKE